MTVSATTLPDRRSGVGHWFAMFVQLFKWNVLTLRLALVVLVMVQLFTGVGMVLGISLLFRQISDVAILYLATGATVVSLVTIGIVVGPQIIAQERLQGTYEWSQSLPAPRSAAAAAWTALNVVIAVPGALGALVAAQLRFDAGLVITPLVVPAVLLVLLAGTLIGFSYAHTISNPRTVGLVSQILIFVVFGFSPIAFPSSNLPGWLAALHRWLPFESMGEVVRSGLTSGLVTSTTRSFLVLSAWTVAAAGLSTWTIGRRS
jgi:ABC-2 type transport system permease protein